MQIQIDKKGMMYVMLIWQMQKCCSRWLHILSLDFPPNGCLIGFLNKSDMFMSDSFLGISFLVESIVPKRPFVCSCFNNNARNAYTSSLCLGKQFWYIHRHIYIYIYVYVYIWRERFIYLVHVDIKSNIGNHITSYKSKKHV